MRHRADSNQAGIFAIIKKYGGFVVNLAQVGNGCPDALIYLRGWHVVEIKFPGPAGWKYTPAQKEFHTRCPVPIPVIQSEEDAHKWAANVCRKSSKQHQEFHMEHQP
jgi:hypothetical protein